MSVQKKKPAKKADEKTGKNAATISGRLLRLIKGRRGEIWFYPNGAFDGGFLLCDAGDLSTVLASDLTQRPSASALTQAPPKGKR